MLQGHSDVLVIGAGPAGTAAATMLARQGLAVVCVDRAQFPRDKTCGDAVSSAGLELVKSLGVNLEELAHAPVRAAAAVLPGGQVVVRNYGSQPGAIVARRVLDDALRRSMQAAGVTLHQGVAVRSLVREHGQFVGATGPNLDWRARLVVAADGPGSVAWAALGRAYPRGAQLGVAATVYLQNAAPAQPGVSEHYFERELPCGYGWLFPPVDGCANVGVYQRADHYRQADGHLREQLAAFMARHPQRFAAATAVGPVRTWALPLSMHGWPLGGAPGLVVCGDAGNFIDPLSGEGIWQALHSGVLAAEHAGQALTAGRPVDAAVVRSYRLACARTISWPSLVRAGIQEGMRWLVDHRLESHPIVLRSLRWGYGSGHSELSRA